MDALVSANRRKAERTLEYHWNPVHPIATPEGGLRPADRASWMIRLKRQISLFEQGSTAALRPELARVKQQVEVRAGTEITPLLQVGRDRTATTSTAEGLPSNKKANPSKS